MMVDILVRNVDETTAAQLKKKARAGGKSVSETARAALAAYVEPSRKELWGEIDRFRERIKPVKGSSLAAILQLRDRDVSGR
jgi:plasmid stability protein